MLAPALIAFREFLEAFLIVGVFLSVSKKLNLKRELEIGLAAACGFLLSLALVAGAYLAGERAQAFLNERSGQTLEAVFMIFAGAFIAYVVFSLHDVLGKAHRERIKNAKHDLEADVFDASLFLLIVFFGGAGRF